jgi:preprotein translocase subunit SecA
LHQALEAKEHVMVQPENQTLASITFQNYFRLYPKLAGMTGTALTEADEFAEIYKLEVIEIPTNVLVIRNDEDDEVYRTAMEKYEAVAELIAETRKRGQPVLVGTTSIEKSEIIHELLKSKRVPHAVLNARYHEQESEIIAQAGAPGAVTIATNMAGRGTDIKLGGNLEMRLKKELEGVTDDAKRAAIEENVRAEIAVAHEAVKQSGGLFVIGTERHESRRIDNQLRGRSGRQGDPGQSRFFLSLEDDLMRIFGSDRMGGMLQRLGLQAGEAIVHPWINKALEKAQKKVEARNFDMRKNVLQYDDVMNAQRKEVYAQRKEFMRAADLSETIADMRDEVLDSMIARHVPEKAFVEKWELAELSTNLRRVLGIDLPIEAWGREEGIDEVGLRERVNHAAAQLIQHKEDMFGPDAMRMIEKSFLIQTLDAIWKEHLYALDHLRQGIGLRAYGQRDPLNEYKSEAFLLFNAMLDELKDRITATLARVERVQEPAPHSPLESPYVHEVHPSPGTMFDPSGEAGGLESAFAEDTMTINRSRPAADVVDPANPATWHNVGRNALCPCGSGKKFKHCHGRLA